LPYLTQNCLLNVHEINKQDTQNNIHIMWSYNNCFKCLFHTNSRAETFALLINCVIDDALLETTPDIDQALLQFIAVMNLLDPLLHFLRILLLTGFRSVLLGGKRSGEMNAGVSFQKVDCLAGSVSRNIALLEDKELSTDLTHVRH